MNLEKLGILPEPIEPYDKLYCVFGRGYIPIDSFGSMEDAIKFIQGCRQAHASSAKMRIVHYNLDVHADVVDWMEALETEKGGAE